MEQSANIDTLEVRHGWKNYYLFGFFIWMAIILFGFIIPSLRTTSTNFLFNDFTISKFFVFIIILSIPTVCLYNYFDRQVKLKINKLGVWSRKTGLIQWQSLRHFHTKEVYGREDNIYYLIFKPKEDMSFSQKEIKIELQRMDKDFNEIRSNISSHLAVYQIEELGHKRSYI